MRTLTRFLPSAPNVIQCHPREWMRSVWRCAYSSKNSTAAERTRKAAGVRAEILARDALGAGVYGFRSQHKPGGTG